LVHVETLKSLTSDLCTELSLSLFLSHREIVSRVSKVMVMYGFFHLFDAIAVRVFIFNYHVQKKKKEDNSPVQISDRL